MHDGTRRVSAFGCCLSTRIWQTRFLQGGWAVSGTGPACEFQIWSNGRVAPIGCEKFVKPYQMRPPRPASRLNCLFFSAASRKSSGTSARAMIDWSLSMPLSMRLGPGPKVMRPTVTYADKLWISMSTLFGMVVTAITHGRSAQESPPRWFRNNQMRRSNPRSNS